MKTRLLSACLLIFLLASGSVPAASADGFAAPAVPAGTGVAFDVVKDVLNPIIGEIPSILKEQQIDHLKNNREQTIKELSDYHACLKDVERKCLQNQEKIVADYNKIRETSKEHNHLLIKTSDEMRIKKQLKENVENYEFVLNYITGLKQRISGLDKLIEEEEKRYQDMIEDDMKGHEIMKHVKALEEENQQIKEENKQLKEQNDRLYSVVKELIRDNKTMLAMLEG